MKTPKTLDRDLSWIYFNHRILQEAQRANVPLLERLSFLGIYSNNLDEFFRVRVSTMKRVAEYESGRSPGARRELREINRLIHVYSEEFEQTFAGILAELEKERIALLDESRLSDAQAAYVRAVYRNELDSATYPLILTRGAQLGELTDSGVYLAVRLLRRTRTGRVVRDYALIELPVKDFGRFLVLPSNDGRTCLIFLDDVVRFCLPFIFAGLGYESFEAYAVKFTRDAEMELRGDAGEGLVEKVARGVKSRKRGEPVRFVYDRRMPDEMLRYFKRRFGIDRYDICVGGSRYHNMKDLMRFPDVGRGDLRFEPWPPAPVPDFDTADSTLDRVRRGDVLFHYPYQSFSNYLRLLREAALSRDVRTIRTTVYRLARNSKVVKALICAARHGKQVTAVVELMARFDEASNIDWAKKMQEAGIRVIFGVEGLKVHAKLTHIGSSRGDIACVSTGNFHEGNARTYTDVALLTADRRLTREVERVFEFIRQPARPFAFDHLVVSPRDMRRKLNALIADEARRARQGEEAYILAKVNHITDAKLIRRLYAAAAVGVRLRLLVRGNCSIVASAHDRGRIEIRGIIDRYLEHSRILIFGHGGDERIYIGSADWMTRNLDNRVEAYAPVYDEAVRRELRRIVDEGLADNVSNAVRFLIKSVAEGEPPSAMTKTVLIRIPLRLGEDSFRRGVITTFKEKQLMRTVKAFRLLMKVYGVTAYRACATSAMRDASNGERIARKIHNKTGIRLEIIDGQQEARIVYDSHVADLLDREGTYLYVDVGGGSTEISLIADGKLVDSHSFDIGTVRQLTGTVRPDDWQALDRELKVWAGRYGNLQIIGSGGNINKLYRMARASHDNRLEIGRLRALYDELKDKTVEQRMEQYSLNGDRADVIVPAAEIFLRIASVTGERPIIVPTIGIIDGIVHSLYVRHLEQEAQDL